MFFRRFIYLLLSTFLLNSAEKPLADSPAVLNSELKETLDLIGDYARRLRDFTVELYSETKALEASKTHFIYATQIFRASERALLWRVNQMLTLSDRTDLAQELSLYFLNNKQQRHNEGSIFRHTLKFLIQTKTKVENFLDHYQDATVNQDMIQLMEAALRHMRFFAIDCVEKDPSALNGTEYPSQCTQDHDHYVLQSPYCSCTAARLFRARVFQKTGVFIPDLLCSTKERSVMAACASVRAYFTAAMHLRKTAHRIFQATQKIHTMHQQMRTSCMRLKHITKRL